MIGKNKNNHQDENEDIEKQINILKEEGLHYHYERSKRLENRKKYTRNNRDAISRVYRYGLVSIAIVSFLLIIIWFNAKRPSELDGNGIKVSLNFFHPKGSEVETQIKVQIHAKSSPIKIDKGSVITIIIENKQNKFYEEKINFDKDITLYPDYPLSYLMQVPKINFIKATHIRIDSEVLGLSGEIKLI